MTIDDCNSVYVGGLPYDVTDDSLRRVFSIYGSVLSVKIVNDRSVRGKCFGFVTFSNRRSADDAIEDMDGKSIGGRVVRVNDVTTRGGRMNPVRGRLLQHSRGGGGGGGWDRSPERGREFNYERDRYSDRSRERDRSHDRRKHHYTEKERAYEHSHDLVDRNGSKEGDEGDWRGDRSLRDNGSRGMNGTDVREGRGQEIQREDSAMIEEVVEGRGRDHFSNSSGNLSLQVKEELETLIKMREALQDEVVGMEDRLEEKEVLCSELQKKSKKLEDSLINEKKLTSQRRKELAKLYKSFSRFRECTDNLKECEQELQSLVTSAGREGVVVDVDA